MISNERERLEPDMTGYFSLERIYRLGNRGKVSFNVSFNCLPFRTLGCFPGTWDEFFTMFEKKQLLYGDYFDWVLPWWNASKVGL